MRSEIRTKYDLFAEEVAQHRDAIRAVISPGSRADELYKGTIILFSDILYQPDYFFIGINPGAGFYNSSGIKHRETELEPDSGFEYVLAENEYDYQLAKQTRDVFRKSSYGDSLNSAVKSNLFYTCTNNAQELYEFNGIILEKTGINLWELSAKWTKHLIQLVSPKVIVCEGKSVVDSLSGYYSAPVVWEGGVCQFDLPFNLKGIGYKRRYSNICDPEALLKMIEKTGL